MKYKIEKKYLTIAILAFIVINGSTLFKFFLENEGTFSNIISALLTALLPILCGMCLAYLLNPVLKFFEKYVFVKLFKFLERYIKRDYSFYIRLCSIVLTLSLFFMFLIGMVYMVVPQVYSSLNNIISEISTYYVKIEGWINALEQDNGEIGKYILIGFEQAYMQVADYLENVLLKNVDKIAVGITSGIVVGVKSIFNVVLSVIISIYVMFEKEKLVAIGKKIVFSVFDNKRANIVLDCTRFIDNVFGGFISGKIIDSFIIGVLCYIFMVIFGFKYPVLISIVVGVTNVIPYFGPFIGAIPSTLILFMNDPKQGLLFAIFILFLQQLDGNFIGPLILGDRLKISSMWILFAILIGGSLYGVMGMVLGAPTLACIFAITRGFCKKRLDEKNLPIQSDFYYDIDHIVDNEIQRFNEK